MCLFSIKTDLKKELLKEFQLSLYPVHLITQHRIRKRPFTATRVLPLILYQLSKSHPKVFLFCLYVMRLSTVKTHYVSKLWFLYQTVNYKEKLFLNG